MNTTYDGNDLKRANIGSLILPLYQNIYKMLHCVLKNKKLHGVILGELGMHNMIKVVFLYIKYDLNIWYSLFIISN